MRNIMVSIDVFAALWADRQAGEDSENAILERLLGLPKGPPLQVQMVPLPPGAQSGPGDGSIYNRMFDVRFPPGFEIFRTYKGKDYRAVVRDSRWSMGVQSYPSLFALSMAIIDSRENPWMHWKYRDANGRVATISALRNRSAELEENLPPATEKPASNISKKRFRKLKHDARGP